MDITEINIHSIHTTEQNPRMSNTYVSVINETASSGLSNALFQQWSNTTTSTSINRWSRQKNLLHLRTERIILWLLATNPSGDKRRLSLWQATCSITELQNKSVSNMHLWMPHDGRQTTRPLIYLRNLICANSQHTRLTESVKWFLIFPRLRRSNVLAMAQVELVHTETFHNAVPN